ncbi:MAG TPA: sigma-70 family RNA polymerase sigma factor [Acidimicrobiales bacterium]|nr:sigma-70 family RNA polymerase sigma factor [Acidimicrobiales bacterium]
MSTKAEADRLIEEYLPLVGHVVSQVAVQFPRHVDLSELASAGTMGLVEAAHRYEDNRGVPFRHFAGHRIRGAILDFVRKMDWAPRSVREDARKVDNTRVQLASALGSTPSNEAVSELLGISGQELNDIDGRANRALLLSLDAPTSDLLGEGLSMTDVLCDTSMVEASEVVEMREMHGYLRDAVASLPEKHGLVVQKTFLEDVPAQEVAAQLGISVSRVSQLRTEALEMLRDGLSAQFNSPDEDAVAAAAVAKGRVARRKASYAAAIATRSAWRDRLAVAGAGATRVPAANLA